MLQLSVAARLPHLLSLARHVLVLGCGFASVACGQKGPLTLPPPPTAAASAPASAATSATPATATPSSHTPTPPPR